jgi:hypothetical protein
VGCPLPCPQEHNVLWAFFTRLLCQASFEAILPFYALFSFCPLFLRFLFVSWWYWDLNAASCLLGGYSTSWATLPVLLCFSYFHVSTSHFCTGPGSVHNSPTYGFPHSWGHRHVPPCPVYWLRWGFANFLPELVTNWNPPDLCLLSSWGL